MALLALLLLTNVTWANHLRSQRNNQNNRNQQQQQPPPPPPPAPGYNFEGVPGNRTTGVAMPTPQVICQPINNHQPLHGVRTFCYNLFQNNLRPNDWRHPPTGQRGPRPFSASSRDQLHRIFAEVVRHLLNQRRLDATQYTDPSNHVGMRPFNQLTPAQLADMAQAVAEMQGSPEIRAAMLYIEAFNFNNLPRADVLRALGTIGGPFPLDVLVREGLQFDDANVRAAAVEGLGRAGPEGIQRVMTFIMEELNTTGSGLASVSEEERSLLRNNPQILQQLEAEFNRQLQVLEQERQAKTAEFEAKRRQAQERSERLKQQILDTLQAVQAPQPAPAPAPPAAP